MFCCSIESSQCLLPNIGFAFPFSWIGKPVLKFLESGGKDAAPGLSLCVFLYTMCLYIYGVRRRLHDNAVRRKRRYFVFVKQCFDASTQLRKHEVNEGGMCNDY